MRKLSYSYLFIILCFAFSSKTYSQLRCTNKLLTEIVNQVSTMTAINELVDEVLVLPISKNKPIVFHRNKEGIIDHIGIRIFNREIVRKHPSFIYYFIERYFLELLLLPTQEEISTKLRMERVSISSEIFSMIDFKNGLSNVISNISDDLSVYVTCANNLCSASCIKNNKVIVKIQFPIRYELLTGYTKMEAESSFYLELLNYQSSEYLSLSESQMSVFSKGLYSTNEDYYVTEDIISTSFYKKENGEFIPIYDSSFKELSVYNLFNSGYDWNVDAYVEQNMYGGKILTYNIPLSQLLRFLKAQGCILYTGIQNMDNDLINGVLMAVNMELGYQHIMKFRLNENVLELSSNSSVNIKMYCYVPIHNVSSII